VHSSGLSVEDGLYDRRGANGLVTNDREHQTWSTIRSGLSARLWHAVPTPLPRRVLYPRAPVAGPGASDAALRPNTFFSCMPAAILVPKRPNLQDTFSHFRATLDTPLDTPRPLFPDTEPVRRPVPKETQVSRQTADDERDRRRADVLPARRSRGRPASDTDASVESRGPPSAAAGRDGSVPGRV
jgi:hypothetical protein